MRIFDWTNGCNRPDPGSVKVWLDGEFVENDMALFRVEGPTYPDMEAPGRCWFWQTIKGQVRYFASDNGPRPIHLDGLVRWSYA